MATNATGIATEPNHLEAAAVIGKLQAAISNAEERKPRIAAAQVIDPINPREPHQSPGLVHLLDKVAQGLAGVLVFAVQELEDHIARETGKVSDSLGQRLDLFKSSFDELTRLEGEQRGMILSIQDKYQQLAATTASLQESDACRASELTSLRTEAKEFAAAVSLRSDNLERDLGAQNERLESVTSALASTAASLEESDRGHETALADLRGETREFSASVSGRIDALDTTVAATATSLRESDARQDAALSALAIETRERAASIDERIDSLAKEMGIQQEDIAALKSTVCAISSRADAIVERVDKQAETLRSMYATYAQRETELEQLVDGLARLRAYPAPVPTNGL